MTGPAKAAVIIALAVVALIAFNVALWRRMRAILGERASWSVADFDATLAAMGSDGKVAAVVRDVVAPCYAAGVVPRAEDRLCIAADGLAAAGCRALDIPPPLPAEAGRLGAIRTVGDLAGYLAARRGSQQPR